MDCRRLYDRNRDKGKIKEKNKIYYRNNKDKERERCEKYRKSHMEKAREIANRTRERHPERKKFWDRRYYENNKEKFKIGRHIRRARIRGCGGIIKAQEWKELCEKYGNVCINPNCPDPSRPVTLDHVVPIFLGGANTIENAQPLCRSCNSRKNIKIIDYRKFYD